MHEIQITNFDACDIFFEGTPWFLEIILLVLILLFTVFCICIRLIRHYRKFPMPAAFGAAMNAPHRKYVQPPSMIVDGLELKPGMKVMELESGTGFFTIEVAKAILPEGIVYAVDIQEKMHDKMRKRMEKQDVTNIIPVLADAEGNIPLHDETIDAAYGVAVLPEIADPPKALAEVRRILKSGGLFASGEIFMDPDFPRRKTVKKWAEQAGFVFHSQMGHALRYVMVFRK
jgi:ubiquinone/menaquinone biosynthesis C-methylase UbiE